MEEQEWHDWLARFLQSKRASNKATKTIESYAYHLNHYIAWLSAPAQTDAHFAEPETIEAFLVHQQNEGYRATTVAGRYRSLRVWYNFLVRRIKCLSVSPLEDVEPPGVPDDVRPYVTLAEYQRLVDSIADTEPQRWYDLRDRCMIYLMFWCGLRVSELVGLGLPDVDANRQQVTIRAGKGGKGRLVPCGHDLGPMLLDYLVKRPPTRDGQRLDGDPLFVSNDGYEGIRGRITDNGVRQMLERRCKDAGMTHLNPHRFRHGYAMLFLNHGMDLSAVSKTMGHASEQFTSKIYAHWLPEGIRREYADVRRKVAPGR